MVRRTGELEFESTLNASDPPCDFGAFVAQRRGISCEQAEQLIQNWLKRYHPSSQRVIDWSAEPNDDPVAARYDSCA